MSGEQIFLLAFYGAFAVSAFCATFRDPDLVWVGGWLVGSYLISNLLWIAQHYGFATNSDKPGIYTMLEVLIAVATYCAWGRYRCLALVALVGVNALSICANIAFASIMMPNPRQVFAWELTTNICFALECILATVSGVTHGSRAGRFAHWPFIGRPAADANAARAKARHK